MLLGQMKSHAVTAFLHATLMQCQLKLKLKRSRTFSRLSFFHPDLKRQIKLHDTRKLSQIPLFSMKRLLAGC